MLNEENSSKYAVGGGQEEILYKKWDTKNTVMRLDFGNHSQIVQAQLMLENLFGKAALSVNNMRLLHDLSMEEIAAGNYNLTATGEDPYVVLDVTNLINDVNRQSQYSMRFIYAVIAVVIGLLVFWQYQKMCILILWLIDLWNNRGLIIELAITDLKTRYSSSYLGAVWAFAQPVVTVAIYIFVFGYAFHSTPVEGYAFVPWLVAGIIPFFYFQDSITMAIGSLAEYSYLVKKVVFEVKILPIVKIVAVFFIHLAFVILAVLIHLGYGFKPDLYYLQLLYYCACVTMLSMGIAYLTTALNVFFRDLQQIVNIILQFAIWLTPIMWNVSSMGPEVMKIMQFNPMYYVVSGYRDCFFEKVAFWDKPGLTIYFWFVTFCFFAVGTYVFQKLEKHFADVL